MVRPGEASFEYDHLTILIWRLCSCLCAIGTVENQRHCYLLYSGFKNIGQDFLC